MIQRRFPTILPMAGSTLFSLLLLAGCATEKALTAQTQPLQSRMERVEQDLSARLSALEQRQQASQTEIQALREQLAASTTGATQNAQQLTTRLDSLAERARQSEQRIDAVSANTLAAQTSIAALTGQQAAGTTAATGLGEQLAAVQTKQAAEASARANVEQRLASAEQRLGDLSTMVAEALAQAAKDIFLANGKEAFTLTLTGDKVLYPQNDPYVDPQDAALLDDLAVRLGKLDKEYHLDIQGHTDNFSTDDNNYNLGKARSEVVKRYLHEKRGISFSRMSTISYGANKPLASGNSRRIYIRVLVLK